LHKNKLYMDCMYMTGITWSWNRTQQKKFTTQCPCCCCPLHISKHSYPVLPHSAAYDMTANWY